jgi:hypothetical protein
MLLLAVRLSQANSELTRLREEHDTRRTADYLAYRQGVMLSLACLLAGLAAASWYVPRQGARRD